MPANAGGKSFNGTMFYTGGTAWRNLCDTDIVEGFHNMRQKLSTAQRLLLILPTHKEMEGWVDPVGPGIEPRISVETPQLY